ncbi:MAG TPA: 16S rRNA (guanine(527)-N(7))-methyltransferase RsmG [Pseudolabrys sp.]|nr:16S rRNA (guanine(527)-N(7))-methyltransferase RsmG [Pseudolabrys sp.]
MGGVAPRESTPDPGRDRTDALVLTPVSAAALARLDRFVEHLLAWQAHTNLIAGSTIPTVWTRHVADSLQLIDLAPAADRWVDFGAGGGFPGLAVACVLADRPGAVVHLVESRIKKANFLREVAQALDLPVEVHAERAENCGDRLAGQADVVTARALASLSILCGYALPLVRQGAVALFLKGQDVELELTEASKYWTIQAELIPSRTSAAGRIVRISSLSKRGRQKK